MSVFACEFRGHNETDTVICRPFAGAIQNGKFGDIYVYIYIYIYHILANQAKHIIKT